MNKFYLLFLLVVVQTIFAQTDSQIIKKDFELMITYSRKTNIDKYIELTYPRLLEIYGKEGTKGLIAMMFNGFGITTIYEENPINLKISKILKIKDGSICLGEYDQNMILEFNDKNAAAGYAREKVEGYKIEEIGDNKVRMSGKSYLLAINDSYTKNTWKYNAYIENPIAVGGKEFLSKDIITEAAKLKSTFK